MKAAMEGPVKLKDKQKPEQTHFISRPLWLQLDPGFGTDGWITGWATQEQTHLLRV